MVNKDAKLKIIVDAQDNTRGTFSKLNSQMDTAQRSTLSTAASFGSLALAAASAGAAIATGFLGYGIKIAADLQTAEIGLATLLGSADKARETVERLKKEAARTPFELPGLTQATQLLTSVTKDGNKSIDVIMNIGEALAAMGKGQAELDRIIVNLQQIASVGRASMVDIKQFAYAGIPVFEMLEKHFSSSGTRAVTDNSKAIAKNAAEVQKLQQQLAVAQERQREFTKNTGEATRMANQFRIQDLTARIGQLNGSMSNLNATNGKVATSVTSVEDAIANGEVTFELLTELFDKANDEGGQFFNAFVNQSGSFNQSLANLKDSFGIFLADITTSSGIFGGLTTAMQVGANFLQNYKQRTQEAKDAILNFFQAIDEKTGLITLMSDMWQNLVMVFNERLKPALVELWETLQPFKPFLDAMIQVFGTMLVIAIGAFILIIGTLAVALTELLTLIIKFSSYCYDQLGRAWGFVTDKIASAIEKIEKFITLMKRAMSMVGDLPGKAGASLGNLFKVNDAVIAPNGNIISTHPDDYIIATKDPSSLGGGRSVQVNINGGTYLSEDAAQRMGDLIFDRLRFSNQL